MYYKELGKIETDEHTGKKYGKDKQIELIGHIERDNKIIRIVKCKECAKDPELHGDSLFETTLSRLTKEQLPDGYTETCSPMFYNDIVGIFKRYGAIELETTLD